MQRGTIRPTKLLLGSLLSVPETETPNEAHTINTAAGTNAQHNFPLRSCSEEHLLLAEADHALADDYELFVKILQAASTSAKTVESKDGNIEKITKEMVNRPDISQGATALHYACMNGNLHMVTYLLENGAQVDMWDLKKRVTPLMCSSAQNRVQVTKLLLEHGCDVDAGLNNTTDGVQSALMWAIRKNLGTIACCLLEHGASQTSTVPFSETPIHAAVACGSPQILKLLIHALEDKVQAELQMGAEKDTPLHLTAAGIHENSLELCKILVEDGNVYVDPPNDLGRTPLHTAVLSQKVEIVKYLLSRSANVNAVDADGRTPLFHAINDEPEALECIEALIQSKQCNIDQKDTWGNSPLHIAAANGNEDIVEILLMNGADFSAKANCGSSALSIMRKKIPTTDQLLSRSFDQAVRLINFESKSPTGIQGKKCQMVVDYKYILPSAASISTRHPSERPSVDSVPRSCSKLYRDMEKDKEKALFTRKETSRLKCLLEEGYSNLLLHPVIHSFLDLKWQKARCVILPTFIYKIVLVLLFSFYVQIQYLFLEIEVKQKPNWNAASPLNNTNTSDNDNDNDDENMEGPLSILTTMYYTIVFMAALKGLMGLIQIWRAPKQQLKTVHPWISWSVLLITFFVIKPVHWKELTSDPMRKPMEVLGTLLAWLDIWIDMGRLPQYGLSIRVFFQVLKNFWSFIMPHCCLLIGFTLACTLLLPNDGEFQSFLLAVPKIIRIMAGDVTIAAERSKEISVDDPDLLAHFLFVYIFTAYIIMVAIVLGNLLIGLAVNDLQGIYKDAAADKLVKQTILLNTLETSFQRRWTRCCIPKELFAKYINLFPSQDSDDKTITFSSNDTLDRTHWRLGSDLKKELLCIGKVNQVAESQKEQNAPSTTTTGSFLKGKRLAKIASKIIKMRRKSEVDLDEVKRMLLEVIDKLGK